MSPAQLLDARQAVLVVIDVQEKMLTAIASSPAEGIIGGIRRMIEVARILEAPILWTEQYPKGLGPTDRRIREALPAGAVPLVKSACSCRRDDGFRAALLGTGRRQVVLVGLETHVCVQQTAIDLLADGYAPFVPVDAVGSRRAEDMAVSVERMRGCGVIISTSESLIFELIERCDHPKFKDVLRVVK